MLWHPLIYNLLYSENRTQSSEVITERGQNELSRAHFLLLEAFDEDEAGNAEEAVELYSSAVELCLEAVSLFKHSTNLEYCRIFLRLL